MLVGFATPCPVAEKAADPHLNSVNASLPRPIQSSLSISADMRV